MTAIEQNLVRLYQSWSGSAPVSVLKLPGSGSYRSYYRIRGEHVTVIGAHNDELLENEAFISFTDHFHKEGLPVPAVLANDPANRVYLITDLGDTTLYQFLTEQRSIGAQGDHNSRSEGRGAHVPEKVLELYKKAIEWLPVFQVTAGKGLDYAVCYPRAAFDRQSMMWDLNYFKYYFLKLAKIPFDEQALEDDFSKLCDLLLQTESDFFLFRDFQSRNIMILNDSPYFIDYQGGRKGALQYDVASLLYDGKANIPNAVRQELVRYYLDNLEAVIPVDREKFMKVYFGFVLIRILQALGAYGFRGYYEQKTHFLQSIPFALENLRYLRAHDKIGFGLDTLMAVIDRMVDFASSVDKPSDQVDTPIHLNNSELNTGLMNDPSSNLLVVSIHSFSYRKAVPTDDSGNGGGFVFDCRALPNPGRFEEFRQLNGKDRPVIDFLKAAPEVGAFLKSVYALVEQSVRTYSARKFTHLMVSFGCTGGQHRSVYCAGQLADYLKNKYDVTINLVHHEHP